MKPTTVNRNLLLKSAFIGVIHALIESQTSQEHQVSCNIPVAGPAPAPASLETPATVLEARERRSGPSEAAALLVEVLPGGGSSRSRRAAADRPTRGLGTRAAEEAKATDVVEKHSAW